MGGRWGFSKATLVRVAVFLEDRLNGSTGVNRCIRQLTENTEDTNMPTYLIQWNYCGKIVCMGFIVFPQ